MEILDLVASGEKVVVRWRATGTFDGTARFEGLAPNGASVDVQGCDMLTVRDGRIQRNDAYMNGAEMARQLGALPPQGSPPERALTAALNLKTRLAARLRQRR
jgi:ketosteroid isomerase-like protein